MESFTSFDWVRVYLREVYVVCIFGRGVSGTGKPGVFGGM